jgi:hypothetical protein
MMDSSLKRVVLDPTAELNPPIRERAARAQSIKGLKVGLLDISKPLGNVFLDRVAHHLTERGAEVLRFSKPTFTKPAPADLRSKIAVECDAVIEALAD